MKPVAVSLLVLGMVCNSMIAMAEGPIPFSALAQTESAKPTASPTSDAQNQSTASSTQPANSSHVTATGKAMIAGGVVTFVVGLGVVALSGMDQNYPSKYHEALAAGSALLAGGVTLVVFGARQRSANICRQTKSFRRKDGKVSACQ